MDKLIDTWLIVDYKSGKVRTMKRLNKSNLKASEMPIHLKMKVEIPEQPSLEAEATIKLGKKEITELMFEEVKDEDNK